jgi:membrane protein DedA with SNARE-associated domain
VVKDVFATEPVIWSARISATTGPLIPNGISFFVGEYLGPPVFTKDGAIWGAFSQHIGAQSTLAVRMDAPP